MTAEHLKASIIDCFKECETELLLHCVMLILPIQYINIPFYYDGEMVIAVYSNRSRRFVKLVYDNLKIQL